VQENPLSVVVQQTVAIARDFGDASQMKLLLAAALLALFPTGSARDLRQTRLMDEIEMRVTLPKGARPLVQYARFYAEGRSGDIVGIYLLPVSPPDAGSSCVQYRDGKTIRLKLKDCVRPKSDLERAVAGTRTWLSRQDELPMIADGGCSVVTVAYRPSTRVLRAFCNGVA
jgi:hypothetical protein